MAYYQGKYKPRNPKKYIGDPTNIIYRSGWELRFFDFLDKHKDVVRWASEELFIPYKSPLDNKYHRYFPDAYVEILKNGKLEILLIEIKPAKQTQAPALSNRLTKKGKARRQYLNEVRTWGINEAKWEAAENYCENRNWEFRIMTENDLFGKK